MAIPGVELMVNRPGGLPEAYNALEKGVLQNHMQQLQNQFYPQVTQSDIDYKNANTNKLTTMTPLEATNKQLENDWYAKNQKAKIDLENAQQNYYSMGGPGKGVDQSTLMGLQHQINIEHPDWTPLQVNQAASAYLNGDQTFGPDNTPLPAPSGIVNTLLSSSTKHTNTAQGLNQQRYALTTDALLNEGQKYLPSVTKYAGILGRGKGGLDAVASGLGQNTPDYNNYIYFTRTYVPAAAGEMMRAFGVNASDEQKKLYMSLVNPISWDQNPAGAQENFKRMTEMFKNSVSKTIAKSPSQIKSDLKGSGSSNSNKKASLRYNPTTGELENN